MRKLIAILLGFLAFGIVGYVGGQGQSQTQPPSDQSEAIRQLELRIERLEGALALRDQCACIRPEKGGNGIDIGGIHFYLVPVNGDTGKTVEPK